METTMAAMKKNWAIISPHLDERTRRLWCAAQAKALGHGGVTAVQKATGVSRPCITRGKNDIDAPPTADGRIRRVGGGRKRVAAQDATLVPDPRALGEPPTR